MSELSHRDSDSTTPYVAATGVYIGSLVSLAVLAVMLLGELRTDPFLQGIMAVVVLPAWVVASARASKQPLSHFGFTFKWSTAATKGLGLLLPVVLYNVWHATWRGLAMLASAEHPTISSALGVAFETGLVAPVAEEMLFRGYMLTTLLDGARAPRRFLGLTTLSWYVSVLFLIPHLNFGTPDFVLTSLGRLYASLVFCWVFEQTRSLSGPIAAHFLLNLATALVALVPLIH